MNYYPFHIGDFTAHTAHLSWEEDIAYRRMLDAYYLREKALPSDVGDVCRLIRMRDSQDAVRAVLAEFFTPSEDGWHNKRADEELTAMHSKQEQQATKDEHEAERMRRHRERRAQMFAALRAVGVVPAWDVPIKELQRLYDENCNAPETHRQREQDVSANAPATAIPTPTPTPTPKKEEGSGPALRADPPTPPSPFDGTNAEALNGKAIVPLAAGWELPDGWGVDAEALGWKPSQVLREAEKFRQYFVAGRGQGTRRSVKGWRQSWSNWLEKAARDAR